MDRPTIHKALIAAADELLDAIGQGPAVNVTWGRIGFEIQYQDDKVTLSIKEREMSKTISLK